MCTIATAKVLQNYNCYNVYFYECLLCKKLKTVMTACGIEKAISYHCGRHSFATLALSKGMPIESVSRVLGHTNIVTTQIYAKITSQKLDNDLTMLGNKLNASFKNLQTA